MGACSGQRACRSQIQQGPSVIGAWQLALLLFIINKGQPRWLTHRMLKEQHIVFMLAR